MTAQKKHSVQILMHGYRYIAVETDSKISISRDGESIGGGKWHNDQLILSTTLIPDDVCEAFEKKIKERMDANWDED